MIAVAARRPSAPRPPAAMAIMNSGLPEQQRDIRVGVLSSVRIHREGLSHVLDAESGISVVDASPSLQEAGPRLVAASAEVVLLDLSVDHPILAMRRLSRLPGIRVVAFGVPDRQEEIVACAEAGMAGYVTREGTVAELVQTIRDAARGKFRCPPHIAAGLLRRVAALAGDDGQPPPPGLTAREREILQLLDHGLSNKEIARLLSIQVATVKNHVHNILGKLGVRKRADAAATVRSRQRLVAGSDPVEEPARI
jgi:two-component system, NarL family, nitrate/nitrite response regulator NarL